MQRVSRMLCLGAAEIFFTGSMRQQRHVRIGAWSDMFLLLEKIDVPVYLELLGRWEHGDHLITPTKPSTASASFFAKRVLYN